MPSLSRRFLISFVSVLIVGMAFATGLTVGGGGGLPYFGADVSLPDNSWFVNGYLWPVSAVHDQDVFYHGIGPSIENARKADILILGHSRVIYGFDWRLLEQFGARYGIKIFNMGFPGEVGGEFPLAVMKKFDLRPKILVVNPSYDQRMMFFNYPKTNFAQTTVSQGWLKRSMAVFTTNVRVRTAGILRLLLPASIRSWNLMGMNNLTLYRSCTHGGYLHDADLLGRTVLDLNRDRRRADLIESDCQLNDQDIEAARKLKNDMSERGTQILFIHVPSQPYCPSLTKSIAAQVGVPYIAVDPSGMSYFDHVGGHLDHNGAIMLTERFLRELEISALFRDIVTANGNKPKRDLWAVLATCAHWFFWMSFFAALVGGIMPLLTKSRSNSGKR